VERPDGEPSVGSGPAADLVDWDLAVSAGRRMVRPGPPLSRADADEVVAELRRLAYEAEAHVVGYTGMVPRSSPTVAVIDRGEWIRSNVAGLRTLLGPRLGRLSSKPPTGAALALGRRVTAVQVAAALAFLSSKVLGQYEIFLPDDEGGGRLSLVAPNVADVERRLGVDHRDFRLWVCLHEQTHRVQFSAVPWLRGYMESEIDAYLQASNFDAAALAARLKEALAGMRKREGRSVVEMLQTPEQRAVLDRLQALMSLLEGHADQVMDAVGPEVVPAVGLIRERFEQRRDAGSPLDRFIRRLLGLDMKMQQYRQGGAFVRALVTEVGVAGFNRVWDSPASLPTRAEITDPHAWLDRVHGRAA